MKRGRDAEIAGFHAEVAENAEMRRAEYEQKKPVDGDQKTLWFPAQTTLKVDAQVQSIVASLTPAQKRSLLQALSQAMAG